MKLVALILMYTLLLWLYPMAALASDDPEPPIAITVVVPRPDLREGSIPAPQPANHVYPVYVWESRDNNRREIIRVYELRENESPAYIPREPFERDGFRFELAEIVRREIPAHSTVDHVEIIEVSTQTNDLETVLRLLSPTLEHMRVDGYFGVLALDVSSIQIESQGTTSSSHTARRTREFPHLSSADTSLIPRTITENGRTYNLADVQWQTQGAATVDYRQIATSFTAVATYTTTATRVSTIGYTTTAKYRGQLSRIAVGRTEFTAHFIGIPIVTPTVSVSPAAAEANEVIVEEASAPHPASTQQKPGVIEAVTVEQVHVGGIVIETEQPPTLKDIDAEYVPEQENKTGGVTFGGIIRALLFAGSVALAYFAGRKGKAMLGVIRRASCLLLALVLVLGTPQTASAAELPGYRFGLVSVGSAMHTVQTPATAQNTAGVPAAPIQGASAAAIHFDPRISYSGIFGGPIRASPVYSCHLMTQVHSYSYGDIIGALTVERLNRTIRVIAGATMEAMDHGSGHFSFTGLNYGNTALIGHNRGRSNGFFDFVRHLREGDVLTLEAGGVIRRYAVTMLYEIDYTDFSPLMQFSDTRLTLVTCVEYRQNQRRVAVAFEVCSI